MPAQLEFQKTQVYNLEYEDKPKILESKVVGLHYITAISPTLIMTIASLNKSHLWELYYILRLIYQLLSTVMVYHESRYAISIDWNVF